MADANVLRDARRSPVLLDRLLSDERLARRCAEGDVNAFSVLYERHHQALYRYCRSIVRDPEDAADALQSAMTKALAGIGGRDPRAPLRAWLFRITHNESISLLRRRSTTAAEALDPERLLGPDVEATAERREALAQLVRDLHSLPERQRGALLMREVGGLSHGEIAAAFGVSAGAVKQSIFEARTALHDEAAGREMSCDTVQRALSDGDGRTARQRRIRGHLRQCEECAGFQSALRARQADLRAVTPLLPAGSAAAILSGIVGGGGGGGGGLVATLLGGGASSALAKGAAVSAVTVTVGAGALGVTVLPDRQDRDLGAALQSRDAEGAERDDGGGGGAVTVAEAAPRPPGGADGRHSGPGVGRDDEAEDRSGRRGDDDAPDDRSGRRDGGDDDDDHSGPGPGARADDPDDHSGPGPGTGEREDRSGPGGGDRLSEDRSGPGGGGDDGVDDHSGPGGGGDTVALAEPDNSGPGGGDDTPDLLETDNSGPGGGGDDVVEVDNSGSGSDSSGSGSSGSGSSDSGVSGD